MPDAFDDEAVSEDGGRCNCLRRDVAISGAEVREAVARVMGGEVDFAERRIEGTSG